MAHTSSEKQLARSRRLKTSIIKETDNNQSSIISFSTLRPVRVKLKPAKNDIQYGSVRNTDRGQSQKERIS